MIKLKDLLEGVDDLSHSRAFQQTGFWGRRGAGCLFLAKTTGRLLISHRSQEVEEPGTWGTWGGAIDLDESPQDALEREVREETGYTGRFAVVPLYVFQKGTFSYYNFLVIVDDEFEPDLDWESQGYQWVSFGEWPTPMHFGLEKLLQHDGDKIKKYVDASDSEKENMLMEGQPALPSNPPAIQQKAEVFSPQFINFIKYLENANLSGFKNGKWYPHKSFEGGETTIAWGHKLKSPAEVIKMNKGITPEEADNILLSDLNIARKEVDNYIKKFGVNIPLSQMQSEMLTEFAFNLGSLRKFPKFVIAVLNQDWKTAEKECNRYSVGTPLKRRNDLFKQRYFSNIPKPEVKKQIPKKTSTRKSSK